MGRVHGSLEKLAFVCVLAFLLAASSTVWGQSGLDKAACR